jgi:hypothetical protein
MKEINLLDSLNYIKGKLEAGVGRYTLPAVKFSYSQPFEDWLFAVGYYLCVFFWSCAFALVDLAPPRTRVVAPSVSPLTSRNWTGNFGATPSPR